ncbi:hypothetical protein LCGC14_2660770 [marine sediment metagenome]|uniref:Uncharacterized protein n=1 Tax=marine sediment metagenome TaxID=412755 RepID=A0A0F9CIY1_9ZZZZ
MAQPGRGLNLTERVKQRLEERRLVGLQKYGKELTPDTNISFIDEAIDEALDLVMYLMALKQKLDA